MTPGKSRPGSGEKFCRASDLRGWVSDLLLLSAVVEVSRRLPGLKQHHTRRENRIPGVGNSAPRHLETGETNRPAVARRGRALTLAP